MSVSKLILTTARRYIANATVDIHIRIILTERERERERDMAEILPIRRKTLCNQSCNPMVYYC